MSTSWLFRCLVYSNQYDMVSFKYLLIFTWQLANEAVHRVVFIAQYLFWHCLSALGHYLWETKRLIGIQNNQAENEAQQLQTAQARGKWSLPSSWSFFFEQEIERDYMKPSTKRDYIETQYIREPKLIQAEGLEKSPLRWHV